jgi:flagellar protein FliL
MSSTPSPVAGNNVRATTAVPHRTKSPFSIVALILVIGGAGVVGGIWYGRGRGQADETSPKVASKGPSNFVHLDGFTVNLADREENHFLRITMELAIDRMPPPVDRDKPNSGLPMGRIRDSIMSVLTRGKADVLLTPEGKQQLKKDLLDALNRENPELDIREIYFTEFLVQR